MTGKPSVSICTVSMNRLHHIKRTLPVNLEMNDHAGINFILLDYSSNDGLEDYIRLSFTQEITAGRLVYYRYNQALSFHRCHSRNLAFRLADGDILCNADADNFLGPSFGRYVQDIFVAQKNICLTGLNNQWKADASGRLCVSKHDFINVTGYDENIDGYGFEDMDIINRLQLIACKAYTINRAEFVQTIPHDHYDRFVNEHFFRELYALYVHFIDPSTSELLYLLNDHTSITGIVVNNFTKNCDDPQYKMSNGSSISQFEIAQGWKPGTWMMKSGQLHITYAGSESAGFSASFSIGEVFQVGERIFYPVSEPSMILEAVSFHTEAKNRERMINNFGNRKIRVNNAFGKGVVYKNFKEQEPIEI